MANNQRLNATISIGGAVQKSFRSALGNTTQQMRAVGGAIREIENRQQRLGRYRDNWSAMGRDVTKVNRALEKTNRELLRQQRIGATIRAQERNTARRGELRGQLFDAVALGAVLVAPIRTAMKFEQQMAKVGAVARASDEELERLTKTARELGATTEWSASQAAEGMQFLAMAGYNTEQTIGAMPGLLSLASAGAIDLGRASDIASNVLSGFNMRAEETGRLGDVLTNTFTTSNTSLESLGDTMKYVAPIAASAGVSLEDTAASAGKLGDAGIQGQMAGTALRAIISRLAAPSSEAAKMLEELGVQTTDANGNLRRMPDILADLNKSMDGFGTAAQANITKTVFGMEAASAATVLLGQAGTGALQDYSEQLKETGSAARVAEKQQDNAAGAMKRLGSATESIAISIGNVLLPTLADGAGLLSTTIGIVDNLAQEFPLVTKAVVGVTAGLIALKVAAIGGGFAFTFLKGGFLAAVKIGLRLAPLLPMIATGIKAIGLALVANPIGLVITGIAVAAGLLIANWEPVKAFFLNLWDSIKTGAVQLWEFLKPALAWSPLGIIINNWEPISNFFSGLWSGIKSVAADAMGWIIRKVEWVGGAAKKLAGFFGFGDDEGADDPQTVQANRAIANVAPARGGGGTVDSRTIDQSSNFTIYQQPGQSTEELAAEIERRQRQREQGRLYDGATEYNY